MTDQEIMHWYHNSFGIEKEILADWLYEHNRTQESKIVRAIGRIEQKKPVKVRITSSCDWLRQIYMQREDVCQIVSSNRNIYVLTYDGKILHFNDDIFYNQNQVRDFKNIVYISDRDIRELALTSEGKIVSWGAIYDFEFNDVKQFSAGYGGIAGIKIDGTVFSDGHIEKPPETNDAKKVFIFGFDGFILKNDGKFIAFGRGFDKFNDIKENNNIVDFSQDYNNIIALKSNGTVLSIHSQSCKYIGIIPDLNNVIKIWSSPIFCGFLKMDGTVKIYSNKMKKTEWKDVVDLSPFCNLILDEIYE